MLASAAATVSPTEQPKPTGRPSKYTPETLTKLLAALSEGNKIGTACQLAGVDSETVQDWQRQERAGDLRYAGFSAQIHEAQALAEQELIRTIKAAAPMDWKAAGWLLARRFGWVDESRLTVDHTGTVTSAIEITVLTSNDLGGIAGLLGTGTPAQLPPGDVIDQEPEPEP